MNSVYQYALPLLLIMFITIGFTSASSSVGSNPGLYTASSSSSWEGDSILNGEDAGSLFDSSSSVSSILDEAEAAGMVMYNTGVPVNDTPMNTTTNKTANATPIKKGNTTDTLSGYDSVGDIIRAQDWEALQRYTSSIDATSDIPPSKLSTIETQNERWDALFTEPQVISCGGCQ